MSEGQTKWKKIGKLFWKEKMAPFGDKAHLPGGPFSTSMIVGARAYLSTLYHLHVHGDNKPFEGSPSKKPMLHDMFYKQIKGVIEFQDICSFLFWKAILEIVSYFFSCLLLRRRFSRCFRFSLVNFMKYLGICCWFQ